MGNTQDFLNLLVSRGIVSEEESDLLARRFEENSLSILSHLKGEGVANRSELGKVWGEAIGFIFVDLSKTILQEEIVGLLPVEFARKHKVMPLYRFGDAVTVAMIEPANSILRKEIERITGSIVSPVFAFAEDIDDAIEIHHGTREIVEELSGNIDIDGFAGDTGEIDLEMIKNAAGDQAVIEFTRALLLLGVRERASDIHLEPGEKGLRIRFRIDGVLQDRLRLDKAMLDPVVSRLKVIAGCDILEKRRPQDGRLTLTLSNQSIDYRFSIIPTMYGEKIALRILGQVQTHEIPDLTELDLSRDNMNKLRRVIDSPNGLFFVTGPTGSGKTTTLYSILKYLNNPGVNIMTIEDPIEYRLQGITQVQVNSAIDLDFVTALRSFLRQDPDVILVGEIRDTESAKTAAQAALTGHLVLSTIHTNSALQAITRLVEIGVEPFLVAPSIIGVMSQRLVRRICNKCREQYEPPARVVEELFTGVGEEKVYFHRGTGCSHCHYTGYRDRLAIHEVVVIDDEVRDLIGRNARTTEVEAYARERGAKSIRYDGVKKALRGLTTIDEINRMTFYEETPPDS